MYFWFFSSFFCKKQNKTKNSVSLIVVLLLWKINLQTECYGGFFSVQDKYKYFDIWGELELSSWHKTKNIQICRLWENQSVFVSFWVLDTINAKEISKTTWLHCYITVLKHNSLGWWDRTCISVCQDYFVESTKKGQGDVNSN